MSEWRTSLESGTSHFKQKDLHASNRSRSGGVRKLKSPAADAEVAEENESTQESLSNASNVLMGLSGKAFDALSEKVQTFQNQLKAMQDDNVQSIAKQKVEYEHQLEKQRADIAGAETRNARMAETTEEFRKTNKVLRQKASALAVEIQKMRMRITQRGNNVSVAMDLMQRALDTSGTLLNTSEMHIMRELDEQDELVRKQLAHVKRVNSIGMLQVGSATSVVKESKSASKQNMVPENWADGMQASLEEFTKQRKAHELELKTIFETRFRVGSDQLQALHDEYKDLYATNQAERELHGKLSVAVQHMEKTYQQLTRQMESISNFFHDMGDSM